MDVGTTFLASAIKRLAYYKELGDKTLQILNEADLHFTPAADNNSIAVIIQHMHGNMLSRWTNFLSSDGEKEWRRRDAEFEEQNLNRQQIIDHWEEGWKCFLDALHSLTVNDLEKNIVIRGESLTVTDAINRQLAHYPYHIGQMILIAKMIKKHNWENLSIPKGQSIAFNKSPEGYRGKK